MNGLTRQIMVLLSCPVMIYVNSFLGNKGGFGGTGLGANGDATALYNPYPTAFSPIPFTFTIWSPIFLGLLIFSIYQALPAQREDARLDALGPSVSAAFVFNTLQALGPIEVNTSACIATLVALFFVFRTLVSLGQQEPKFNLITRVPLMLFFGWMTVAVTLSISQYMVSVGWTSFSIPAALWGAVLILIAACIGFLIIRRTSVVAYGVALVWGFWGIAAANPQAPIVITTLVVTGALVWSMVRAWRSPGVGTKIVSA